MKAQNDNSNKDQNATCDNAVLSSRLLKFRAWITNLGVPFMAIQGTPDLETLSSFMHHYSDAKNIMQFTGFYDKNGKEIYIGDILMNEGFMIEISTGDKKSKYKEFYEVVDNGSFYTTRKIKNNYTSQIPNSQEIYSEFYEVIGNIFQNPELL